VLFTNTQAFIQAFLCLLGTVAESMAQSHVIVGARSKGVLCVTFIVVERIMQKRVVVHGDETLVLGHRIEQAKAGLALAAKAVAVEGLEQAEGAVRPFLHDSFRLSQDSLGIAVRASPEEGCAEDEKEQ
jgi:hypothetical protein